MNCDCKCCDPWMMAADNLTAQNQIREFNPDSTTHSSGEQVIECDPSLPDTTSKEGEVQDPIVSSSASEVVYTSDTEEEDILQGPSAHNSVELVVLLLVFLLSVFNFWGML